MMEAVCKMTQQKNLRTLVQLNPVMLDGTGLCGSCRVKINDQILLACMEGPEFKGEQVDFEFLKARMNAFTFNPQPRLESKQNVRVTQQEGFLDKIRSFVNAAKDV